MTAHETILFFGAGKHEGAASLGIQLAGIYHFDPIANVSGNFPQIQRKGKCVYAVLVLFHHSGPCKALLRDSVQRE